MNVEFDPEKDELNIAKYGVSLARAVELAGVVVVADARFAEPRFRLYGAIDDVPHPRGGDDARQGRPRHQPPPRP